MMPGLVITTNQQPKLSPSLPCSLPCPPPHHSSSLMPSPPKIGCLGPDSSMSHPSLSPGLCTHMRMAQMTSSLQHQEVRIPAIPLPSHHLLWLFCCPPWLQFTFLPPSSRPTCRMVSFLLSSLHSSGCRGREPCFLFGFREGTVRKRNLPDITQLGKGPRRVARLSMTFFSAGRLP